MHFKSIISTDKTTQEVTRLSRIISRKADPDARLGAPRSSAGLVPTVV